MTTSHRYAVPLDAIDRVRVRAEDQTSTQAVSVQPLDASPWGGALPHSSRDGASGGGGAEGGGCSGGGSD